MQFTYYNYKLTYVLSYLYMGLLVDNLELYHWFEIIINIILYRFRDQFEKLNGSEYDIGTQFGF